MLFSCCHLAQASKYPPVVSVLSKRAKEREERAEEPARVTRFPGGGFKARMEARARWAGAADTIN